VSEEDSVLTYRIEHQWRPLPAVDFSAGYQHGVVPSARTLLTYDQVALRPIWRIGDGWHLNLQASYSYYEDRNSLFSGTLENFWRLSQPMDVWLGLHNSIDTMDLDSNLYWSPYRDERHYLMLRIRRSYPDYYGLFRVHLGYARSRSRPSQDLLTDEGWTTLIGFEASVNRTWDNGFELNATFSVNNTDEYTEYSAYGALLYKF
jgi:hypothetical protein